MRETTSIICKDCGSTATHIIANLPDVNEFAGKTVSPAIKGGCLVECKNCFVKFRSTTFDQSQLTNMYDGGLSEWEVAENRNDWKLLTAYIDQKYGNGISVLDIGCNRGEILAKMSPQNDRFGLEINKTAAAIANKVEGLTVWNNYDEIPSKMKFDVIFSTDVIEHITTPTSFLKPLHDMLNEGGSLIITSGDAYNFYAKLFAAKWWYWYFPEHISFISKKWLTKFANEQGFIIKEIKKFYYHRTPALKRLRLLAGSLLLATMNLNNQMKLLQFIHKTKRPNRFQIGKGVSKDHIFVVLQAK